MIGADADGGQPRPLVPGSCDGKRLATQGTRRHANVGADHGIYVPAIACSKRSPLPAIKFPGVYTQERLKDFLQCYLGGWPDTESLSVVGSPARLEPGWDGTVRQVVGVAAGDGGVLSVPPDYRDGVSAVVTSWDDARSHLAKAMGRRSAHVYSGTFRWTFEVADLSDAGVWVPWTDPRVPPWLHPFGHDVLITFIDGRYAAGVGIKRHTISGMEISVGTEPEHRGQGLASRLVAQAARWILNSGAVPIYLHDPTNIGSAKTAERAGFADQNWKIIGLS